MESTKLSPPHLKGRGRVMNDLQDEPRVTPEIASAHVSGNGGHAQPHEDDWGKIQPPSRRSMMVLAIVVVIVLLALFGTGFIPRVHQTRELNSDASAAASAPVMVNVVLPQQAPADIQITVPGSMRPWQEVSIFARTTGYLKKWYADISNQVKQGDLLAEIDTPEVDEQLGQARGSLAQMQGALAKTQSDVQIAKITNERFQALKGTSGVTQQDLDQKQADYNAALANLQAAQANVVAAEANVKRLTDLQSYEKVYAPFSGVITSRPYDTGALINADPTVVDIKPMYKIAETDVLRVFVNVPQSSALSITKGMDANIMVRERPGRVYVGKVMGTTNYLDLNDRTLLTEIKVPNTDHSLLPGMYVQVGFTVNRIQPPLIIPGPAVVNNADGTQIAVVRDGKVHFVKVELGQDFGNTVEINGGLTADSEVIGNPGERIVEGAAVAVIRAAASDPASPNQSKEKVAEVAK